MRVAFMNFYTNQLYWRNFMSFVKIKSNKPRRNHEELAELRKAKRKGEDRKKLQRGRDYEYMICDDLSN
ncbi:hypothetical protein VP3_0011 [Vibrio phage VP3]|uniref:Uncharacterized protein n=1 Tax=Vibrio phage VP3 TaxID=588068 RepID=H9YAF9_9CAUD|nr:hypothetical protein VP3_0011 [Vibrio phage VP3]